MIKLTRLDGSEIFLNEELFEIIEETPDTHITLTNGNRYLVREKSATILERITARKTLIMVRALRASKRSLPYRRER